MGWRYLHWTLGAIVFVLSILRVTVLRLQHSPKWLITQGRDTEVVETLQKIATEAGRPLDLTAEQLRSYGDVKDAEKSAWSFKRLSVHVYGLFNNPEVGVFCECVSSNYITWKNYAITQLCGLFGLPLAAYAVETKLLGRRGTLALTAIVTAIFQFGYTQVKTPEQNLGVVSATTIFS
ncbi:uncharacterized protein KY384_004648 [Bacidia gigantensis]|uniref:uncharacterized protein n=1 Tax=Bacidia gigantensis TaxID=2732470 RepID=UPI001D04DA92|nr:uncharacterized protein KY384_004648 [Bacidia gigantensis]KAG8530610.1 hypothetical protein KY384_004648 [Bacidia gigantensis]